jgi:hypothetical protein
VLNCLSPRYAVSGILVALRADKTASSVPRSWTFFHPHFCASLDSHQSILKRPQASTLNSIGITFGAPSRVRGPLPNPRPPQWPVTPDRIKESVFAVGVRFILLR